MQTTACGVCLVVLAAVVQSWDTSCVHCVKVGILVVLAAVVQSWDTSCVHLCESWYSNFHTLCTTATNTTRHTPHAVVYIVCSPDDGHNDA